MIDTHPESGLLETWSTPRCPFTIEYSRRALDDIRLAVVDAFFSLPRGGAEIGGILLGKFQNGRLVILDYAPLECEHAFGPSFTLSAKDQERLAEILESCRKKGPDVVPVGWYHSHTRSEILLSETDLEIHNRYFPESWHVALVLRPSSFQPVRAGFFFREQDGSIYAQASYGEFLLDSSSVQPAPTGMLPAPQVLWNRPPEPEPPVMMAPAEATQHAAALAQVAAAVSGADIKGPEVVAAAAGAVAPAPLVASPEPPQPVSYPAPLDRVESLKPELPPLPPALPSIPERAPVKEKAAAEEFQRAPERKPEPEPRDVPAFLQADAPAPRRRGWILAIPALAAGVAGFVYYQRTRPDTKPASIRPAAAVPVLPATVSLSSVDHEGQLQIRWDQHAAPVLQASGGVLQINDSGQSVEIPLDSLHLQTGGFTYLRRGDRVDAKLSLREPDGRAVQGATSFLGALPAPPTPAQPEIAGLRKQAGDLGKKNQELLRQAEQLGKKNEQLGKQIADLSKQNAEVSKQNAGLRKDKDDITRQAAKLKSDLAAETARSKKLQQDLDQTRKGQQKKRLENQFYDPLL